MDFTRGRNLFGDRDTRIEPPRSDEDERGRRVDNVPKAFRRKDASHRAAAVARARDVIADLPGPGESLHALMCGRYDLVDVLDSLFEHVGTVAQMRIATLSYGKRNIVRILEWIDAGRVERLSLLCSLMFREMDPQLFNVLHAELEARGPAFTLAASRNHAKVICLDTPGAGKWIIEGSANLRTNSNEEQFAMFRDAGLHDWHAAWIDARVATYGATGKN